MSKRIAQKAPPHNGAKPGRSTGPRTPEGKARSSLNATKHGIFARSVIPPSLQRYEDRAEFTELLAGLREHLAPVGPLEAMLVEHIASFHWRLARLNRAEGGAISQAQEQAGADNKRRAELLAIVKRDSQAIEAALQAGDLEALRAVLDPQGIYPSCQGAGIVAMAHDQLQRNRADARGREIVDPFSACDRASLPFADEALKLARYEAHLQRQLHRAIATLERLQARRAAGGPSVPQPDPSLADPPTGGQPLSPTATPNSSPPLPPSRPGGTSARGEGACAERSRTGEGPCAACGQRPPRGTSRSGTHSPRGGGTVGGCPGGQSSPGAPTPSGAQFPLCGSAAHVGGTVGGSPSGAAAERPNKHESAKRTPSHRRKPPPWRRARLKRRAAAHVAGQAPPT